MGLLIRRINQGLAHTSAAVGYHLWRETLAARRTHYADARSTAPSRFARCHASVMTAGLSGALYVRTRAARPAIDRLTGTGWDNARPPGRRDATSAASLPDIDRLDLGRLHRALAMRLGGSDAAVLAVHPLFFVLRMSRHAVVATVTGVGFAGGCIAGALRGVSCVLAPASI